MSGDVNHWFDWVKLQLKAPGIDNVFYSNYISSLLQLKNSESYPYKMPPALDSEKKIISKTLVNEFKIKANKVKNPDLPRFEVLSKCKIGVSSMDPTNRFSNGPSSHINCIEPVQPCLPPNVPWTWGLLHDSTSDAHQDIMDESFSKVFHKNPTESFESEFASKESDSCEDGRENDRIIFYNKQNLLASECKERLYERNADVDKLIAKFDANIEDIWKTTSESDYLKNVKYQNLFSQNLFPNPFVQYGSNMIWAFEENKKEAEICRRIDGEKNKIQVQPESFFQWNKFSSPVLSQSHACFSAVFGSLSKIQKAVSNDCSDGSLGVRASGCDGTATSEADKIAKNDSQNSQEEEDLLTSAKTHFRPIRAEDPLGSQTGNYADGTTFPISNDLEKVSFKRSESGALYLEADADTPRKYMEFKEKDGGNKGDCESDVSSLEEFVPKFRVRQNNEKCCQTDEIDGEQIVPSLNKSDCESVSCESEEDEFYFPGDDELAQNIANSFEEETLEAKRELSSDKGMEILESPLLKTLPVNESFCNHGNEWTWATAEITGKQEWKNIWNFQTGGFCCRTASNELSSKDKFRFREELTQEGEQLLMDLSCLQQMYSNSDWRDDDSSEEVDRVDGSSIMNLFPLEAEDFRKGSRWNHTKGKVEPVRSSIDLKYVRKEKKILSNFLENDKSKFNETNERPLIADMKRSERKRRNSSSQKACNLYLEGQCRRPHCRFAHFDSAIPCPFFADASCMKVASCPLSHSTRRPLSL